MIRWFRVRSDLRGRRSGRIRQRVRLDLGPRAPSSAAAPHHHRFRGGCEAISRRFRLAPAWIAAGTLLGVLLPVLGIAVIAAFIPTTGCRSGVRSPAPSPARPRRPADATPPGRGRAERPSAADGSLGG